MEMTGNGHMQTPSYLFPTDSITDTTSIRVHFNTHIQESVHIPLSTLAPTFCS